LVITSDSLAVCDVEAVGGEPAAQVLARVVQRLVERQPPPARLAERPLVRARLRRWRNMPIV
jgi:hypothetical protein